MNQERINLATQNAEKLVERVEKLYKLSKNLHSLYQIDNDIKVENQNSFAEIGSNIVNDIKTESLNINEVVDNFNFDFDSVDPNSLTL